MEGRTKYSDSGVIMRYPLKPEHKPAFQIGTILKDIDCDDEYSIITEIYTNYLGTIFYTHRELNDMTRVFTTSERDTVRFYKEA